MNKLGTLKICPKCNNTKFSIEYVAERTMGDIFGGIADKPEEISTIEHMLVTCNTCGYSEEEYPLDINSEPISTEELTMCDTPQTKNTIVFEDRFIKDIRLGFKTSTIRNSPVALGCYKIDDDLTIEVYRCQKQIARETIFNNEKAWKFYSLDALEDNSDWCVSHEALGFESLEEMYKFYKSYLKRDYMYHIEFIIK